MPPSDRHTSRPLSMSPAPMKVRPAAVNTASGTGGACW
jgi:hypothetical protein